MFYFKRSKTSISLGITLCLLAGRADSADGLSFSPDVQIKGLVDARLALTQDTQSWQDRGFGKARYGGGASGDGRALARLAEASLILQARLTWDLSAIAHVAVASQQQQAVDAIEAFLTYKPASTSAVRFRAKAGAFFPPISLENTGLAWTSPFTISSSAINSWVGEELRVVGTEATLARAVEGGEVSITTAAFGFNDPAGSVLAWRGWAVHDREAGLFDRLPLAQLPAFRPGGSASGQISAVEPFTDLDDRVGYYVAANWVGDQGLRLRAIYYDNRANDLVFDGRQYAWNTRFGSIGASIILENGTDIVAQAMAGNTKMATFPTFSVVNNDFASAFVLASHEWDRHRISSRAEYFEVRDRDFTRDDPNGERGRAVTFSYIFRPDDRQRFTVEVLNIRSTRQRRIGFGLPARANETLVQASYRFFFSTN
jgi:hypothetical protein